MADIIQPTSDEISMFGNSSLAGSANASVGRGMMRNKGAQLSCVFGDNKPYDEEVNYLESHGTEFIDTLFKLSAPSDAIHCKINKNKSPNDSAFFGSLDGYGTKDFAVRTAWYASYYPATSLVGRLVLETGSTPSGFLHIDEWYLSNSIRWVNRDGTLSKNEDFLTYTYSYGTSAKIFSAGGTGKGANLATVCRVYFFKIMRNGLLMRDMIPVVKSGVGYMYDRCGSICSLTGTPLYANAGTGAFTWGQFWRSDACVSVAALITV